MSEWKVERRRDFSGGENKLILPEFVGPNQLINAQNCVLSPEGIPQTRLGKSKVNTVSLGTGGVLAAFRYAKEDATKYLVAQHGTSLYSESWDGAASVTFGAAVKSDITEASPLHGEVWKDKLFLGNGVDACFTFDGSAVADVASAPKFSMFCVYAGRIWGVDPVSPNLVQWSGLEDYTAYDPLDVLKIRDGDGDIITGIKPVPGGIFITKNNSCGMIRGTNRNNIQLDYPISENFGSVPLNGNGILTFGGGGLFLGYNSLFQFSASDVNPVFSSHRPTIQLLSLAQKQASFAASHPVERRAYFNLGSGDTLALFEQERIDTGERYYAAYTWKNLNAGCFAIAHASGDDGSLLIGDKDNGFIYKLDNETDDDGTAIETLITTPYDDQGISKDKIWRYFQPELEVISSTAYSYLVSYDVDYNAISGFKNYNGVNDAALVWDEGNWDEKEWGPSSARVKTPYWLAARGDRISFSLKTNTRIKFIGFKTRFREVGIL